MKKTVLIHDGDGSRIVEIEVPEPSKEQVEKAKIMRERRAAQRKAQAS